MAFLTPLPFIPAGVTPETELNSNTNSNAGLPHFTKSQFSTVDLIGVGSYGKVFRVKHGLKHYVLKELSITGKRETSLFKKEASLLKSLAGHDNIVRIHGFSVTEHAMLLGYECFHFNKVGVSHEPVHSLRDYLKAVDKLNRFSGFHHTQYHLTKDICTGLLFLHEKGIVHRDLKPDNILVSNNHYENSSHEEVQIWWASKPIIAKLTDFGESRSTLLQTSSLSQTSTSNLNRGSPAYMAPEALLEKADRATFLDLQRMDLWSLGMILFSLINPDLAYPYAREIEVRQERRPIDVLKQCIGTGKLPKPSEKYNEFQNGSWQPLMKLFFAATKFQPKLRSSANQILQELLNSQVNVQSLLVSQASVTNAIDEAFAKGEVSDPTNSQQTLNACSFLSVLIADKVISSTDETPDLVAIMQDLILNFPKSVNAKRSQERLYSIDEAYNILLSQGLIKPKEFEIRVVCKQEQTITEAKDTLCNTLVKLLEVYGNKPFSALYTCPPYIFAICKPHKGELSIVDTHPIGTHYHGKDTAGVITGRNTETSVSSLCCWLFRRIGCVEKVAQELAVMTSSQDILPTTSGSVGNGSEAGGIPHEDEHRKTLFDEMQCETSNDDGKQAHSHGYNDHLVNTRISHGCENHSEIEDNGETCTPCQTNHLEATSENSAIHRDLNSVRSSTCENQSDGEENEEDIPCKRRRKVTSHLEESSQSIFYHDDGNSASSSNRMNLSETEDNEEDDVASKRRKLTATSHTEESSQGFFIGLNNDDAPIVRSNSSSEEEIFQEEKADSTLVDDHVSIGSDHYFCEDSHWHMDCEIPVFQLKNKVPYAANNLFKLIFDQESHVNKKCSRRPLCVRQDAVFLLDLKHIDPKDIRADGNGTYSKELRHYRWVMKYKNGKTQRVQMSAGMMKDYHLQDDEFFLYWNTYSIPKHGLRRQINWIIDRNGKMVNDVGFLQYSLPAHVTAVHFLPENHGNSKTGTPFSGRLSHSSLEAVKGSKRTEKPSTVVREFHQKDPLMIDPCSLPSAKSVYNCRYRQSSQDPLQDILDFNEELPQSALIGHHGHPGITLVFQTENMKSNARFLDDGAVLQVDTTFGQHNFYVTVIATQDKSLKGRDDGYPWVMIAVAFHEKKTTFVHELIVHDIVNATTVLKRKKVNLSSSLMRRRVFGRRGSLMESFYDVAITFNRTLKSTYSRICTSKNRKPHSLFVQYFRENGLIDCDDKSEFEESLESLKQDFSHWEASALNKEDGYSSKAYNWLLTRSDMISKRLLKGARRKAGYPIETRPNTNGIEAFNHRLKQVQGEMPSQSRKLSYVEYFTNVILVIEKDMAANLSRALIGRGSYKLSPDYNYLAVPLDRWTAASSKAKAQFLEKVKDLTVKDAKKKKIIALTEQSEGVLEMHHFGCSNPP